jgi:hypothetical protein
MPALQMKDFDRSSSMWDHYWAREVLDRPLVVASVIDEEKLRDKKIDYWGSHYQYALRNRFDDALGQIDAIFDATEYLGEAVPYFSPDHGPDQFAAFLGTDLEYAPGSPDTNWAHPVVQDWNDFLPLRFDANSKAWKGILEYSRKLVQHSRGRYAVSVADLHSNIDALAALRGSEKLCMDLYECPDLIEEAMKQVRPIYPTVYNTLYEAGDMKATGTIGWAPFWCRGRYATIQADIICLMSPELGRKYVIPALEEEASFLDHCVYHLDGPGTLPHLDDILSIKKIDTIQWVPGAGQPPQHEWMDLLKRCQKAGKGLQLLDVTSLEVVKKLHRELDPAGLVYCVGGCSRAQVMEIIDWLEKNT